jgi:hypothetical protein
MERTEIEAPSLTARKSESKHEIVIRYPTDRSLSSARFHLQITPAETLQRLAEVAEGPGLTVKDLKGARADGEAATRNGGIATQNTKADPRDVLLLLEAVRLESSTQSDIARKSALMRLHARLSEYARENGLLQPSTSKKAD